MAFNHQIPHEMAFQVFTDQPEISVGGNGGSGAPTWLNNAVFRQQNFLHLQAESESRNDELLVAPASKTGSVGDRRSHRESGCRGEEVDGDEEENEEDEELVESETARYKAGIVRHPLYEQLLSTHVSCLRIATPVDQLPKIDAQLAQSQRVVAKYSAIGINSGAQVMDEKDLDQFMVCFSYLLRFLLFFWILSSGFFLSKMKTLFFF